MQSHLSKGIMLDLDIEDSSSIGLVTELMVSSSDSESYRVIYSR